MTTPTPTTTTPPPPPYTALSPSLASISALSIRLSQLTIAATQLRDQTADAVDLLHKRVSQLDKKPPLQPPPQPPHAETAEAVRVLDERVSAFERALGEMIDLVRGLEMCFDAVQARERGLEDVVANLRGEMTTELKRIEKRLSAKMEVMQAQEQEVGSVVKRTRNAVTVTVHVGRL